MTHREDLLMRDQLLRPLNRRRLLSALLTSLLLLGSEIGVLLATPHPAPVIAGVLLSPPPR